MKRVCFACLFIVSALACGKGEGDPHQAARNSRGEENPVVERLNTAGLERLLDQRNGKALFLNVWATWCLPCKEEFPDLVRLAEAYKNRPIEFVGLSADYPEDVDDKIKPFLQQMRVNFKVYVQDFSDPETLINRLNPTWNGAIPATFLYDSSGKQRAFLVGRQTYEQFRKEIEKLLAP